MEKEQNLLNYQPEAKKELSADPRQYFKKRTISNKALANELSVNNDKSYEYYALQWLDAKCKNFNEDHRKEFIALCMIYKLNPFKKEIHPITFKDKTTGRISVEVVISYAVYLKRASATGLLNGIETEFSKENVQDADRLNGLKCTAIIYRKDWDHPFKHTCYFREYNQGNSMWAKKPLTMLNKVTISQAIRLAFSEYIDGLPYIQEELDYLNQEDNNNE